MNKELCVHYTQQGQCRCNSRVCSGNRKGVCSFKGIVPKKNRRVCYKPMKFTILETT